MIEIEKPKVDIVELGEDYSCLLYTSDAADD